MELVVIYLVWGAAIVTGIWLLVVAFKQHLAWGLTSLLVPGAVLVFVIVHWQEAWKPFLANLVASLALWFVVFSSAMNMSQNMMEVARDENASANLMDYQREIVELTQAGELSEQEAKEELRQLYLAMMTGASYQPGYRQGEQSVPPASVRIERGDSPLDKVDIDAKIEQALQLEEEFQQETAKPPPKHYRDFVVSNADEMETFVGRTVRITTTRGEVREGGLSSADKRELVVAKRVGTGTVSYHMKRAGVAKLEVLQWLTREQ